MATNDYAITDTLLKSLFGPSPEQKQQAYQQARDNQAMQMAQLTPGRGSVFAAGQTAQDLEKNATALGGAIRRGVFGIETPKEIEDKAVEKIKAQAQPLLQQGDMAGYADFLAQEYAKAGLNERAARAKAAGDQFRLKQAELGKLRSEEQKNLAQAEAAGKKKPLQIDLGDRVEFRDPDSYALLQTVRKGMTPAQAEKQAAAEAEQKPGFIGKTGAYRNQYGEVIPGAEMSKQRKGFQAGEDLLNKLNTIQYEDVVNAESMFDYAGGGETKKAIGSKLDKKTVDAQTKIAAAQLLQQINSLPPGSASDADMRQAAKEFPGFGDSQNLANWVNRTKETLQNSLERQADQYGFNQRIKSTGNIRPKKAAKPQGAGTKEDPIKLD